MSTEETKQTVLRVEGMTCGSCVRHVDAALREVEGVRGVAVKLREGLVVVQHEDAAIDAMIEALRDAGYASTT